MGEHRKTPGPATTTGAGPRPRRQTKPGMTWGFRTTVGLMLAGVLASCTAIAAVAVTTARDVGHSIDQLGRIVVELDTDTPELEVSPSSTPGR